MERDNNLVFKQFPGFDTGVLTDQNLQQVGEDMCSVCHEEFLAGQAGTSTSCNHFFHYHCLMRCFFTCTFISQAKQCPLCRTEIIAHLVPRQGFTEHMIDVATRLGPAGRAILTRAQ